MNIFYLYIKKKQLLPHDSKIGFAGWAGFVTHPRRPGKRGVNNEINPGGGGWYLYNDKVITEQTGAHSGKVQMSP